jgi:cytokinesis protein
MKRKQAAQPVLSASTLDVSGGPPSPAGTGAMDDLLAKLRAAKPEARDQRDRRRRARLKDRYQDRVASGQKMPELDELVKPHGDEGGDLLSPVRSDGGMSSAGSEGTQPNSAGLSIEEEEDVADRAEKLLMGLGGEGEDDLIPVPRESIRMSRRRKEGAEDERSKRRRRRQLALSASEASLENHTHARDSTGGSIREEDDERPESRGRQQDDDEEEGGETPKANGMIVVSPPSPQLMATPSKGNGMLTPPGD